jgi:hypothetical protein
MKWALAIALVVACKSEKPAPKAEPATLPAPIPQAKPPAPKRPKLAPCSELVDAKMTSSIPINESFGDDGSLVCAFTMMTDDGPRGGSVLFDCDLEPMSNQLVEDVMSALVDLLGATRFDFERAAVRTGNTSIIWIDRDMPNCKVSLSTIEPRLDIDAFAKDVAVRLKP